MATKTEQITAAPDKHEIALSGVQETTLVTLRLKAQDHQSARPILNDRWAAETLERISYDAGRTTGGAFPSQVALVAIRSRKLDAWTADFVRAHPDGATVLHLGCGLDSRGLRLADQGVLASRKVRWVDVDMADIVDLRRKLLPGPAAGDAEYMLLSADVVADDDSWLQQVPADRPTAIVFEGLAMYLTADEGRLLIERVATRFSSGEILFDAIGSVIVNLQNWMLPIKKTGAKVRWGLDDPKALEQWHDGLKLKDAQLVTTMEEINEMPLTGKILFWVHARLPYLRYLGRFLRYEF